MSKMTQHDLWKMILQTVYGSQEVTNTRVGRYTVMTRPQKPGTFYFLGSAGAIRIGRVSSTSAPMSEEAKAILVKRFQMKMAEGEGMV